MGVLNVTPDSFSDGGAHAGVDDAAERAKSYKLRAEADSFPRVRAADPLHKRRRIHFAAAKDARGGSGECAASTPLLTT